MNCYDLLQIAIIAENSNMAESLPADQQREGQQAARTSPKLFSRAPQTCRWLPADRTAPAHKENVISGV